MWMMLVRLRAEGDLGKDLAQMVYENFQEKVEEMVHQQGVVVCLLCWLCSSSMKTHSAAVALAAW